MSDKHASGETSKSQTSGEGGKHTREQDKPDGYPVGTRTQGKHHPDGWGTGR